MRCPDRRPPRRGGYGCVAKAAVSITPGETRRASGRCADPPGQQPGRARMLADADQVPRQSEQPPIVLALPGRGQAQRIPGKLGGVLHRPRAAAGTSPDDEPAPGHPPPHRGPMQVPPLSRGRLPSRPGRPAVAMRPRRASAWRRGRARRRRTGRTRRGRSMGCWPGVASGTVMAQAALVVTAGMSPAWLTVWPVPVWRYP